MKKTIIVNNHNPENQHRFCTRIPEEGRQQVYYDKIEINDKTGQKDYISDDQTLCRETYRYDATTLNEDFDPSDPKSPRYKAEKDFDLNAPLSIQEFFEDDKLVFRRCVAPNGSPYSATHFEGGEPVKHTYEDQRNGTITQFFKNGERISRIEAAILKIASGKLREGIHTLFCQESIGMAFNHSSAGNKTSAPQQSGNIIRLEQPAISGRKLAALNV